MSKSKKKLKMTTQSIDEEVYREVMKDKEVGARDSFNSILRRKLGLDD